VLAQQIEDRLRIQAHEHPADVEHYAADRAHAGP
jgi:hypothetical protein